MSTINKALEIVATNHNNVDKSGRPYILHPLHVMHKLKEKNYGDTYLISGILHDVVEDTDVTLRQLKEHGFSKEVLDAVSALTHESKHSYEEYIEIIAKNDIARAVKLEDLRHNMDISRRVFKDWSEESRDKFANRMLKYIKAYDRLVGGRLNV